MLRLQYPTTPMLKTIADQTLTFGILKICNSTMEFYKFIVYMTLVRSINQKELV